MMTNDDTGVLRRDYAAAMAVAKDQFRMLAQGIPNACFYLNRSLEIEFVNEAFANPFGRRPDELLGRPLAEIFDPDEFAKHEPYLRRALDGETTDYESQVGDDGHGVYLKISNRPIYDESGAVTGVFSEATDVTHLHELEQVARENEKRIRIIAEGVPSQFIFLDPDLRIQFANDAFLAAVGWSQDEAVGRHIAEALTPEQYVARQERYAKALSGEEVFYESRGGAGNLSGYFRFWYRPDIDADGNVRGIFSMALDITERHEMEVELQRKQAELVRSNQDLEQFAYVASHDLKAPLRSIEVLVQWIREDLIGYENDAVQENLDLLSNRTQRLNRLLDDLLNYSRAGRRVGQLRPTDSRVLVQDVVQLLDPPSHLEVELVGEFPTFTTHATPLEQTFRNLIGNAIKHHDGNGGRISVTSIDSGDHYLFSVADDGPGIPDEFADRIFEMFQTLKPRDQVEGSGMGLAIVNRIVTAQGGRVWVERGPDEKGAVFRFQWMKQAMQEATNEVAQA